VQRRSGRGGRIPVDEYGPRADPTTDVASRWRAPGGSSFLLHKRRWPSLHHHVNGEVGDRQVALESRILAVLVGGVLLWRWITSPAGRVSIALQSAGSCSLIGWLIRRFEPANHTYNWSHARLRSSSGSEAGQQIYSRPARVEPRGDSPCRDVLSARPGAALL
jgi:hypothetical protein